MMADLKKNVANEDGFVLVFTVFLVLFLVIMIGIIGTYAMGAYKNQEQLINDNQAFFMAESGLNLAKSTMIENLEDLPLTGCFYPGDEPWLTSSEYDFSNGNSFKVWVSWEDIDFGSIYKVVSKGTAQNKSRILTVKLKRQTGMFIRKESDKIIETTEQRLYFNDEYQWSPYPFTPPTALVSEGTLNSSRTITGDHRYSGINLSKESLVINGPANLLIEGNITLKDSSITIQGSGSVNIYLTGNFDADNKSLLEVSQPLILNLKADPLYPQTINLSNTFHSTANSAKDFLIVAATDGYTDSPGTSINIDFKNKTCIRGGIFAPNAEVNMVGSESPKIVGAIVASKIYSTGGLQPADYVQYDPAIFDIPGVTEYSPTLTIEPESWGEYE